MKRIVLFQTADGRQFEDSHHAYDHEQFLKVADWLTGIYPPGAPSNAPGSTWARHWLQDDPAAARSALRGLRRELVAAGGPNAGATFDTWIASERLT